MLRKRPWKGMWIWESSAIVVRLGFFKILNQKCDSKAFLIDKGCVTACSFAVVELSSLCHVSLLSSSFFQLIFWSQAQLALVFQSWYCALLHDILLARIPPHIEVGLSDYFILRREGMLTYFYF